MNCCQCQGIEMLFDRRFVAKDLARYRAKGPDKTTRMLLESLEAEGVKEKTLLDIGGGVGAISNELFKAGLSRATNVEASSAYLEAAKEEAERQGHADRMSLRHGNFVDLAADIPPADIVTLDRVICCFPDMQALVGLSAARAGNLYGVVYPRDAWWAKIGLAVENFVYRLQRSPFRVFAHPTEAVEALVTSNGLKRRLSRKTFVWQVVVYSR
jgi:predicted TPR repeat methyltransferase